VGRMQEWGFDPWTRVCQVIFRGPNLEMRRQPSAGAASSFTCDSYPVTEENIEFHKYEVASFKELLKFSIQIQIPQISALSRNLDTVSTHA
jgi:hypothetical protein